MFIKEYQLKESIEIKKLPSFSTQWFEEWSHSHSPLHIDSPPLVPGQSMQLLAWCIPQLTIVPRVDLKIKKILIE